MSDGQQQRTDVNKLGEFGLIEHLTKGHQLRHASSLKGIGDDAAVIDNGAYKTVISTDMLVEGIHFDMAYVPLEHLGYKSVVVNLSDIYAMNATPKQITVSIALSNRYSVEALELLYKGINRACDFYNVDLIGGDTTSSPKGLIISITAIGQGEIDKLTYRNGAQVGDLICVSGDFGAAYLGLQLLEREKQIFKELPTVQPNFEGKAYLVGRQLKPEARKDIIRLLRENNIVPTSMIDVSDGLASEIFHICKQSEVGAILDENHIPIHPEAEEMALKFQLDPITCALNGGEDYELLFTIKASEIEKIRFLPDIAIVGEIVEKSEGIMLHTKGGNIHAIKAQGWQHFNSIDNG
jgi:thiamine-monophosphate kinase